MMTDDPELERRLRRLGRRIEVAREHELEVAKEREHGAPVGSGLSRALSMSAALVADVALGVGLGLVIDWWFGTSPVALVILFFLGFAAGIVSLIRAAQRKQT